MSSTMITILTGVGLLIFAYLLFSNAPGAVSLLNAGFSGANTSVKTLQGR